jgi:hypothetical protein
MRALAIGAAMAFYKWRLWRPLARLAETPAEAQTATLRRILTAHAATAFGARHHFADIHDMETFRARVPIQEYDDLRPWIEEQRTQHTPALTSDAPLFYAQTSGTTGAPKYIPVTKTTIRMHRDEQALFSYLQYRACPEAFHGKALGIMGASVEGRLDSGHHVGSISGHLYEALPRVMQARFVVPPAVFSIADYDVKYLTVLHLALAQPGVTYMGSPNPSTFVRLQRMLNERRDELLDALASGRAPSLDRLPPDMRAPLASRLRPQPARARALRAQRELTFASVWPALRLLTTWTGGSCGVPLAALRQSLPPAIRVMELGYQATEMRGTIPIEPEAPGGLAPLHHHVFEFVDRQDWDAGRPAYRCLNELEAGALYYVVVTTAGGLYRYFMNDLVEVTGRFRRTPLIRFVQKGKGVTSLTGEKLYETQVIEAVRGVFEAIQGPLLFYVLVAVEEPASYTLLVEQPPQQQGVPAADPARAPQTHSIDAEPVRRANETLAADLDRRLGALNMEYQAKRKSGRRGPVSIAWLPSGTAEACRAAAVREGQREGQLKIAALQYQRDLTEALARHLMRRTPL